MLSSNWPYETIGVKAEHKTPMDRVPEKKLPAAGKCIYCLRSPLEVPLTDEHIIPDGLWGDLLLLEASCKACAQHIRTYEENVINGFFGMAKLAHSIQSRKQRGRGRKSVLTYRASSYDGNTTFYDPVWPGMPHFITAEGSGQRPAILSGTDPCEITQNILYASGPMNMPADRALTNGGMIGAGNFSRFIAKVAHGYAVSVLGIDGFKPFLLQHVLSPRCPNDVKHIGNMPRVREASGLHRLRLSVGDLPAYTLPMMPANIRRLVIVQVDLFLNCGLPSFEAVVGEIPKASLTTS